MEIRNRFVEEYVGADGTEPESADTEPMSQSAIDDRAAEYEGEYRTTAFEATYEKVLGLQDRVTVSAIDDGYLETERSGARTIAGSRWNPASSSRYRGPTRVAPPS